MERHAASPMKNVVVLISGRGSNLGAILAAFRAHGWPVRVAKVISNRPQAPGLALAQAGHIPTAVIDHKAFPSRETFDAALAQEIEAASPDLVVLAGFMRILSAGFCRQFAGRLLNIHPSLLPAFKGTDTHQQAIDAGVKVHGCTVHAVTPELDHGPILAQAVVPVLDTDDANALAARVLECEHQVYPMAIAAVLSGRCRLAHDRWLDTGRGSFDHEFTPCVVHPSL